MGETLDLSQWYGAHYFRTYRGAPYERSPLWLDVMQMIATGIVRECNPRTVLDAGCAMGFLVEALRDRGVEAYGFDHSAYAIDQVHARIKPYCWVGSLLDPIAERYDLIVCHEVLEHLPAQDADAAIARLCAAGDCVLFSSTPDGYSEDTHLNVQPVDYWAGLFAKHGFTRDLDFDTTGWLAPWACRFRRSGEPLHRTVASYERRVWTLSRENVALRARVMEQAAAIARQDQALRERPDTAALERAVDEQREHLDALNERLLCMTDREVDLRRMVLDAHEQLLHRDQLLMQRVPPALVQQLQATVDERTAWAQQAVAELDSCRAVVRELQETVDARTTWAQQAVADLDASRAQASDLQETVDARTAWAQRTAAELDACRQQIADLQQMVDARTAWAQRAVEELESWRTRATELQSTLDAHATELAQTRTTAQRATDEATQLRASLAAHAQVITQITNSPTWRAGAPLRKMKRLLTNGHTPR